MYNFFRMYHFFFAFLYIFLFSNLFLLELHCFADGLFFSCRIVFFQLAVCHVGSFDECL